MRKSNGLSMMKRSVRSVLEHLEDRRLMAATLVVTNGDGLPSNDRLIFNRIQNPDTTLPNAVHDQAVVHMKNEGNADLTINSVVLSGPWQFVGTSNFNGTVITPGSTVDITLRFVQASLPPHATNQTNFTTDPNGGAVVYGSLTINSSDTKRASVPITLAGYWQKRSEHNNEPNLNTIVRLINGYQTVITDTPNNPDLTQDINSATFYGEEITGVHSWARANTTQPVSLRQIAAFHTQGNTVRTFWYGAEDNISRLALFSLASEGQTLLPHRGSVTGGPLGGTFVPTTSFGFRVDNEYSDDAINVAKGNTSAAGHHFRFYPLKDSRGNVVANTYIMAMDYSILQTKNYDFNDNVYIVSNITPFAPTVTPPTPVITSVQNGPQPVLTWDPVTFNSLAGYNVRRATSAAGPYTLLTLSPQSGTTFTDSTAPSNTTLFYQLTAVANDTTESAPATAQASSSNTPIGPTAVNDAFDVTAGQAIDINVLANDADPDGNILPSTLTIVNAPTRGTFSKDSITGIITYTPNSNATGTDSLTYHVTDDNSITSGDATVTFTIVSSNNAAPTTLDDNATTLLNTPVTIDELSNDSPEGGLNTSSVVITNSPDHGTAVVESDGRITYTPGTNFLGSDKIDYTVIGTNNVVSSAGTISIQVGIRIGNVTGAYKSLTYSDADGAKVTAKLNIGQADVFFFGNGTAVVNNSKKTVTATAPVTLTVANIVMTGTTKKSTLSVLAKGGTKQNDIFGISSDGPLYSIVSPTGNFSGVLNVQGLSVLRLRRVTSSDLTIGKLGASSVAFSTLTDVDDTSFTSEVRIRSINVNSWTNTGHSQPVITAPALGTLLSKGEFTAGLQLSGKDANGNTLTGPILTSAIVKGDVHNTFWDVGGNARFISLHSAQSDWGLSVSGKLSSLIIKTGGIHSEVFADTVSSLIATGDSSLVLNANTATFIRIAGALSNSSLTLASENSFGTSLRTLSVKNAITNTSVRTAGNIVSLVAAALIDSTVQAGTTDGTTLATANLGNIGSKKIASVVLKNTTTTAFSNSSILAGTVTFASVGNVNTSNSGNPEGIAATAVKAFAGRFGTKKVSLGKKQLVDNATLTNYLTLKGIDFGDFQINLIPLNT